MRCKRSVGTLAAATLFAASGVAFADHHMSREDTLKDGMPVQLHRSNGVHWVSGGVSDREQAYLEREFGDYSLQLVNVRNGPEAAYVADVRIMIMDDDGDEVIDANADGPWLFADLDGGTYRVSASFDGQEHDRTLTVTDDGTRRLVMDWEAD